MAHASTPQSIFEACAKCRAARVDAHCRLMDETQCIPSDLKFVAVLVSIQCEDAVEKMVNLKLVVVVPRPQKDLDDLGHVYQ